MSAQGLPTCVLESRQDAELSWALRPVRLREGRPADLGPRDSKSGAIRSPHRRKGDIYADGVDELLYGRLSNVL